MSIAAIFPTGADTSPTTRRCSGRIVVPIFPYASNSKGNLISQLYWMNHEKKDNFQTKTSK
jgi:hypothetical protein